MSSYEAEFYWCVVVKFSCEVEGVVRPEQDEALTCHCLPRTIRFGPANEVTLTGSFDDVSSLIVVPSVKC